MLSILVLITDFPAVLIFWKLDTKCRCKNMVMDIRYETVDGQDIPQHRITFQLALYRSIHLLNLLVIEARNFKPSTRQSSIRWPPKSSACILPGLKSFILAILIPLRAIGAYWFFFGTLSLLLPTIKTTCLGSLVRGLLCIITKLSCAETVSTEWPVFVTF